jgi:hypothetical protein
MAKKAIFHRIEEARAAHAAYLRQIADKQSARNAALLAGEGIAAIARIDGELAALEHASRTEASRIALLDVEVAREKQAAVAKQRQAHIVRFAKKLAEADTLAREMQDDDLPQFLKKIRKIIELREGARAGFAVTSSHANAAAGAIEGCAFSGDAVLGLLQYELYRISAKPLLGGRPGERTHPPLPGAKCPRLEWQHTPERITGFADALRAASKFAVDTLRSEIGSAAEIPAALADEEPQTPDINVAAESGNGSKPERTPTQARLGGLLKRMSELAEASINDPAAEREYHALGPEIAKVQSEVDAEKGTP